MDTKPLVSSGSIEPLIARNTREPTRAQKANWEALKRVRSQLFLPRIPSTTPDRPDIIMAGVVPQRKIIGKIVAVEREKFILLPMLTDRV
jgi:hypothetical protein